MLFEEFETEIYINSQPVKAKVQIKVEEDDISPEDDFDFGDEEENRRYLNRFKSGELFIGIISVVATALGEDGSDVLGGCHLNSNHAYDSNPFNESVNETISAYSMVENALNDLRTNIVNKARELKKFA